LERDVNWPAQANAASSSGSTGATKPTGPVGVGGGLPSLEQLASLGIVVDPVVPFNLRRSDPTAPYNVPSTYPYGPPAQEAVIHPQESTSTVPAYSPVDSGVFGKTPYQPSFQDYNSSTGSIRDTH